MAKYLLSLFLLGITSIGFASKITVSGQLNSNTTWSADSVIIVGAVVVESGVTLEIDSGINVLGGQIEIRGALKAMGTASHPISFRSFENGNPNDFKAFWGMKWVDVAATNDSSFFNYCVFEKLGNDPLFEIRNSDKVAIRNCTFNGDVVRNSLFLSSTNSNTIFHDNLVKNFDNQAMEFVGGLPSIKRNIIDSCLNYQWGGDLIYLGSGGAMVEDNILTNCGDSLNPSETSALMLIGNGSTALIKGNLFENCWFLALRIEGGSSPQIIECTIKNCFAGVLLSKTNASNPVVFRKTIIDGTDEDGIYAGIDVRAQFIDCTIKNCKKSGLTVVRDSEFEFVRDSFINNKGSGLYVAYSTTDVNVDDCFFKGNSANYGGGMFIADRSNSTIKNSVFVNNLATTGGGLSAGSGSTITNCTFKGNYAYSFGGGAFVQGCVFANNTLINNMAYMGGGLGVQVSSYYRSTYENNYIGQNFADSLGGGAVIVIDKYVKFRNNHIENNKAVYAGGGLSVYAASKSWISGLLINNNEAPFGAGINFEENGNNELNISNLSVVYNKSSRKYAAMRNKSKDELFFTNTVFWGNESTNGLDFYSEWDNLDPWYQNCVVQGGKNNFDLNGGNYNGTWSNVDEANPNFNAISTAGVDTVKELSYFFPSNSNLYNGGKSDTSGLRISANDLIGQKRIKYGRIDIGAVEFLNQPAAELQGPSVTEICQGRNIVLSISGTADAKVEWYKDGNIISTVNASFSINNFGMQDAGKYWIRAYNTAGESVSDTLELTFKAGPKVILVGVDTTLCVNNDYIIRVEGSFDEYKWSNDKTDNQITPTESGDYWVEASNIGECAGRSDTISIGMITPSFTKNLKLNSVGEEWRLYTTLENNDGFDSLEFYNTSENWKESTFREFLIVSPSNGDGDYVITSYLNGCKGIESEAFLIVFPSTGAIKEFKLNHTQTNNNLVLNTDVNSLLQLSIYNIEGKEIFSGSFNKKTSINVSDFKNQIVMVKVFDGDANKTWVDKVFIR